MKSSSSPLSRLFLLLTVAVVGTTTTAETASSLDSASFAVHPRASEIPSSKNPIAVDFYTTPEAKHDFEFLQALRPLVVRLHDSAIQFEPRMVATRGQDRGCAQEEDGSPIDGDCSSHCVEEGRYCDLSEVKHLPRETHPNADLVEGRHFLEEGISRRCVWKYYGLQDPTKYFDYFDGVAAQGCQDTLQFETTCQEMAYTSAGMDIAALQQCMGKFQGDILEEAVTQPLPDQLPALFVDGKQVKLHHGGSQLDEKDALKTVCDAFPEDDKPQVCRFCLDWCPHRNHGKTNIQECLWSLHCADGAHFHTFEIVLAKERADALRHYHSSSSSEGWSIAKIFMSLLMVLLAGALIMVAVAAIRIHRSKMVIDRYLREKAAQQLQYHNDGSGGNHHDHHHHGHRDFEMFPQEEAVSFDDDGVPMDFDQALSYSDVMLGESQNRSSPYVAPPASSAAAPPPRMSFLPEYWKDER